MNTRKCTTLNIHVLEVLHKPISCLVAEFESWKICDFLVRNDTAVVLQPRSSSSGIKKYTPRGGAELICRQCLRVDVAVPREGSSLLA